MDYSHQLHAAEKKRRKNDTEIYVKDQQKPLHKIIGNRKECKKMENWVLATGYAQTSALELYY